jgi:hypothetical protein
MILLLEVLPTLIRSLGNLELTALLRAFPIRALFNDVIFLHQSVLLLILVTDTELAPCGQSGAVKIRFIGVRIAIEGRVDGPFHHA